MKKFLYAIKGPVCSSDNARLYWSNHNGWVSFDDCEYFEKSDISNLPIETTGVTLISEETGSIAKDLTIQEFLKA